MNLGQMISGTTKGAQRILGTDSDTDTECHARTPCSRPVTGTLMASSVCNAAPTARDFRVLLRSGQVVVIMARACSRSQRLQLGAVGTRKRRFLSNASRGRACFHKRSACREHTLGSFASVECCSASAAAGVFTNMDYHELICSPQRYRLDCDVGNDDDGGEALRCSLKEQYCGDCALMPPESASLDSRPNHIRAMVLILDPFHVQ
ncbi:uncharacterized protein M421DRAFT_107198 [Didymella exigua CBS 183.55]|uniref:Uncharacterized protein n=1 Tax=Didymella exigua CBS 183.55 TaxID=1150837 RepID=A0A6A5RZN6_9PLEO|nr:uncharacterized protein M421DRAFT_107198 [Didymella exigua CBS 183.55]KAF1933881.1 hypothetical protein M421DRAFT_107198 [Didymella exigua CBS 183.55]